jgi:hypothetical protein
LFERSYRGLSVAHNAFSIVYDGGTLMHKPPRTITLTSQRFGYSLTITTLSALPLTSAAPARHRTP